MHRCTYLTHPMKPLKGTRPKTMPIMMPNTCLTQYSTSKRSFWTRARMEICVCLQMYRMFKKSDINAGEATDSSAIKELTLSRRGRWCMHGSGGACCKEGEAESLSSLCPIPSVGYTHTTPDATKQTAHSVRLYIYMYMSTWAHLLPLDASV